MAPDTGTTDESTDDVQDDAREPGTDVTEDTEDTERAEAPPRRPVLLIGVLSLLLVALLVVAGVSGARWWSAQQREDREEAALAAARTAAVAVLSYDHRTLDADFARARGLLTKEYAAQYGQATGGIAAGAKESEATVRATVRTASVITSTSSQASLLLYVDQTRTGKQVQDGSVVDQSAIRVTVRSVDGRWLVSDLAPLG